MSVHKRGRSWQVKWRDENGQQRAQTFKRKGDADALDEELSRRKRLGPQLARHLIDKPETTTLDAFVKTGLRAHLAPYPHKTREQYRWALELHLSELLDLPLYALDVPALSAHQAHLLEHGRTPHTVRYAMTMLSGVLGVAVEHGLISANPVRSLQKVQLDPKDDIVPLSPVELEQLVDSLAGRGRIIAVLAGHLGLSPIEVRLVPWAAWTGPKLTIPAAKTKRQRARTRVIDVPLATQSELRHWRLASGRRDQGPIIGDTSTAALKQWGTRSLKPRLREIAGIDGSLYTLRHSHASALHYCGYTPASAARRMGHSVAMHWQHYAHVVEALEGQPHHDGLDALIAWARESAVPLTFPNADER